MTKAMHNAAWTALRANNSPRAPRTMSGAMSQNNQASA
jgi:hypothetical protein